MTDPTHTPTPWAVCDKAPNPAWTEGITIYSVPNGTRIGDSCPLDSMDRANAAYIVKAVNEYERLESELALQKEITAKHYARNMELVEALKFYADGKHYRSGMDDIDYVTEYGAKARVALAKAGGDGH